MTLQDNQSAWSAYRERGRRLLEREERQREPLKRGTLVVLCGIPGSGKSTWARTFLDHDVVVSSDDIREEILRDAQDQSANEQVFAVFHDRILHGLRCGKVVVADSTALDARSRETLRGLASQANARLHLIVFTNLTQAITRNQRRDRVVPEDAMMNMVYKYERTMLALPTERPGYSSVTEIAST